MISLNDLQLLNCLPTNEVRFDIDIETVNEITSAKFINLVVDKVQEQNNKIILSIVFCYHEQNALLFQDILNALLDTQVINITFLTAKNEKITTISHGVSNPTLNYTLDVMDTSNNNYNFYITYNIESTKTI